MEPDADALIDPLLEEQEVTFDVDAFTEIDTPLQGLGVGCVSLDDFLHPKNIKQSNREPDKYFIEINFGFQNYT